MTVEFEIPGRIRGKGRPRFARRGNFVTTYTPAETEASEAVVRKFAAEAMNGHPLLEGPVRLSVNIGLTIPASWSKKKRANAIFVTGKPDADNIIKLLGDAMNGIVFKDDSQIAQIEFCRLYTTAERVHVTVSELRASLSKTQERKAA